MKRTRKIMKLEDVKFDNHNPNVHTERGLGQVIHSINELGAGRSGVADKSITMIGGNLTLEAAIEAGLTEAEIVESDGTRLVIVVRTDLDLTDPAGQARRLSVADNRAAEVSIAWSAATLQELKADGFDVDEFFLPAEQAQLFGGGGNGGDEPGAGGDNNPGADLPAEAMCPKCGHFFIPITAKGGG